MSLTCRLDIDEVQFRLEAPEKVEISYDKRGNAENYIKEAKYDMAVGHLLLKAF